MSWGIAETAPEEENGEWIPHLSIPTDIFPMHEMWSVYKAA